MQISISNIVKGTVIGSAFTAISRYFTRVTQAGAIYEKPLCVESGINSSPLLQQASMLILPSGYKGGTAYAELPSNGNGDLTWTRASDAWRTNADGLIQRVPWNLLQRSEEFDNAIWGKASTTIVANAEIAPNGTITADTMTVPDSTTNLFQGVSYGAGEYTFSVYVKIISQTTGGAMRLQGFVDGANVSMNFTPTNEWQRVTATYTATTSITSLRIRGQAFVGTLAIWGAQLVEGSSAQTYFPTTDRLNVPRLSYMYGSCPALLLEPQRTNLVLQSETFDNASWTKSNTSVTANSTTSPSGIIDADTLAADGTLAIHFIQSSSFSATSGTAYTTSFYAKKNTNNFVQVWMSNSVGGMFANFDLNNGVVGTLGTVTGTAPTSSIINVGNGWYRCSITFTSTATITASALFLITTSASSGRAESNTLSTSVFIYGAQIEAGAYATTYIPTTSATATRVADSFSRGNIYTNGLITSSGGTWFVELRNNVAYVGDAGGDAIILGDSPSTLGNNFRLFNGTSSGRMIIYKTISGSPTSIYTTTTTTIKIAIKWNGSTADIFANGTKVVSATTFTATALEFFSTNISAVPKYIQQMALYPSPLTDDQCEVLTGEGFGSYAAMALFYQYNLV